MKKVAYLLEVYPSETEYFIANEIDQLRQSGLEVIVFALRTGILRDTSAYYVPSNVALVRAMFRLTRRQLKQLFTTGGILKILRNCLIAQHISRVLKRLSITHVHAHFGFIATVIASELSKTPGISFSCSLHARDIYANNLAELKQKIEHVKFIVTCTGHNKDYLVKEFGDNWRERMKVIYHGIDLEKWRKTEHHTRRHTESKATRPVRILAVGRLVEKKGFLFLLSAIRLLKDRGIPVNCRIIGRGSLKRSLELFCKQNDIGNLVEFKGYLVQDEVREQLKDADVFVLPCVVANDGDRDGIPNVLMEAMAMDVPVISTDVSGIPELLKDGVNGLLVKPGDPVGLANAIAALHCDGRLYRRLTGNCRESLKMGFDSRASNVQLMDLFSQLN